MTQRSAIPRGRCSILRPTGNLCGRLVDMGAPFPICAHHAQRLYEYMLRICPPPQPEQSVEYKRYLLAKETADERAALRAERKAAFERQSQVYYVRIGDHIKIGYTVNMYQRLIGLRVSAEDVLATEPGARALEAQRHAEFAAERIGRKENFNPSPRLLAHIEAVKAEHGEPRITNYKTAS